MWTQALHVRSPKLSGAPPDLARELEVLFNNMTNSHISTTPASPPSQFSSAIPRLPSMNSDVQFRNSSRIHHLVQQIRAMPEHEGFMHGLPFEQLAKCAAQGAVVMLVAAVRECHALILPPNERTPLTVKLLNITPRELKKISLASSAAQMRGSVVPSVDDGRMMKVSSSKIRTPSILGKLWETVVKPSIDCLDLQVCASNSHLSDAFI
jgi:hypothetical protein